MKGETKTAESIKIVQHTKYGLIDIIENKDCLEVRQLSQYGGRDTVLILPENRKSVALAICPELTQQQSAYDELKKQNEELVEALKEIQQGKGAYSLDRLEHAGNVIKEMKRIATEVLSKHTT